MLKKIFFIFLFFLVLYFKIDAVDYLDTTFGSNANGIIQTTIGTTAQISGTTVDTNGNIIVAGSTTISGVQYIVVARYTSSGTLDTSFNPPGNTNAAGIVTLLPTSVSSALATAVTVDLSNNVFVAGIATISGSSNIVIAKFKVADGSLDSTFGTGGVVTFNIGNLSGANSIVHDSSGRIYITGFTNASGTQSLFIARFTTVGQIDTTWGTGDTGYTVVNFGNGCLGNSVTIDGNANIVVGGSALPNFLVVRFVGTTGLLDPTFGTGGIVTTSNNGSVQAVAIDSSNRIVACGYVPAGNGNNNFALARYTTSGILDTTFNSTGLVTTAVGVSSQIFGGLIDNNGNIVVSGVSDNKFATARYNSNGSLDTTFGPSNSGIVTTSVGLGAQANSIALQSNGKIVSGGLYVTDNVNGLNQFCLLRYNKNNTTYVSFTYPTNSSIISTKVPTITGASSAISISNGVQLAIDGGSANNLNTDGSGNWSFTPSTALSVGSHTLVATLASDTTVQSESIFTVSDTLGEDTVVAYSTVTQTTTTANSFTNITFNNTTQLNSAIWTTPNNTTLKYIAPISSKFFIAYEAIAGVTAAGLGVNFNVSVRALKNGSEISGTQSVTQLNVGLGSTGLQTLANHFILTLNQNDTIQMQYATSTTTASGIIAGQGNGTTKPSITVCLVRLK